MKKNNNITNKRERRTAVADKLFTGALMVAVGGMLTADLLAGLAGNIVFFSSIALGALAAVLAVMLDLTKEEQERKTTWAQKLLTASMFVCFAGVLATERFIAPVSDIVFTASLVVGIICAVVLAKLEPNAQKDSQCETDCICQ